MRYPYDILLENVYDISGWRFYFTRREHISVNPNPDEGYFEVEDVNFGARLRYFFSLELRSGCFHEHLRQRGSSYYCVAENFFEYDLRLEGCIDSLLNQFGMVAVGVDFEPGSLTSSGFKMCRYILPQHWIGIKNELRCLDNEARRNQSDGPGVQVELDLDRNVVTFKTLPIRNGCYIPEYSDGFESVYDAASRGGGVLPVICTERHLCVTGDRFRVLSIDFDVSSDFVDFIVHDQVLWNFFDKNGALVGFEDVRVMSSSG